MPILVVLCAAQFMVILDITVVNVALPSIAGDVGIARGDLQWLITAYTLAFGGLLLVGGRAADLLGRRRMFLTGLGVFVASSLGAAVADSGAALIGARVAQGVGAAMLSPAALSLVTTSFPDGPERRRALAAWAAVAASGGAFGVLVGGALIEVFGWQAIFLINVPVGVAVALGALAVLPAGRAAVAPSGPHAAAEGGGCPRSAAMASAAAPQRLDLLGAALATSGLVALIFGLVEAPDAGWSSAQTLGALGAGAALLAAFAAVESRVRDPLVRLAAVRRRPTAVALALMIAGMGTVVASFFFLTLYLQDTLGHSPLQTGLEFLPGALVLIAAAHAGGHLVGRFGPKPVLAGGMALGALGAALLSGAPADGRFLTDVLPGLLVLDLGIGLAAPGIFITAMAGVRDDEAGMVSGLLTTAHELGIALVLPVIATVAASSLDAGGDGFGDAFRVAAAIAAGAALLALVGLRRSDAPAGAQPAFAH